MEFKGSDKEWILFENVNENGRYLFTLRNVNYENKLKDFQIQASTISEVETLKANMLLCSKAPEMLEMLKKFLNVNSVAKDFISEKWFIDLELLIKQATEL
jgi:hypothetical protein